MRLTKTQRTRLERQLDAVLARFGERIERVIVRLSSAEPPHGFKRCRVDVGVRPKSVSAEHSDSDIFLALEHAASRVARSVSRAIETEAWVVRR